MATVSILGLFTSSCKLDEIDPCPCITSITPATARAGESITLAGEFVNFDAGRDRITIDGTPVQPDDVFGNQLKVTLPTGIQNEKVPIVVNINGCNSNALESCTSSFDYKKVTATAISRTTGRMDDTLRITGANFRVQDKTENAVDFEGVAVDNIVSASENQLVVIVPKGAETGNVRVTVDGFEVIAGEFTYFYTAEFGSAEVLGSSCAFPNFERPIGITADLQGNIFVADEEAHQIFKINATTGAKEHFAGNMAGLPGSNPVETDLASSNFNRPWDVALDQDEVKYIADFANGQLRKIEADRVITVIDGLNPMYSVVANQNKDLFFSDITNIIKMLPQGSSVVENYASGFNNPTGLFIAENGDLYVADTENQKIRYIEATTGNIIDVAGDGNKTYADGLATEASFNDPRDLLIDDRNNIFVAESGNNRVRVITPTGYVYTLYGNGGTSCDSGLNNPWSITVHETLQQLTLYVADTENGVVKKIIYK